MRARLLVALLLVAAVVQPAAAAPKPPTLAGTVRVSAARAAVMDVRLPKPVTLLHSDPPRGTTISGDGRIIGLFLLGRSNDAVVLFARYGLCATEGCKAPYVVPYFFAHGTTTSGSNETLAAGDYRLVVLTDGKPVTAVLTLPGLKGTANLKPTRYIPVQHRTLGFSRFTATPVQTAYSDAVDVDVDGGDAVLLHQFRATADLSVQQQGGFCRYTTPVGEPAPRCPGGFGTDITITKLETAEKTWVMRGHLGYLHEGTYRAGPYYRALGAARDPVGTIAWVVLPPR